VTDARGLDDASGLEVLRSALLAEAREQRETHGLPTLKLEGKLLRPVVAMAAGGRIEDQRFVRGALAIQAVHEASLLHDDILDDCAVRRGVASVMAREGKAAALVEGDHLLTAAYRLAAETGSMSFVTRFTRAVERTVAGEKAQAHRTGCWLTEAEYREIIGWKSGALFGCAASLPAALAGREDQVARDQALGARLGQVYQMVDDFLDLCPSADLGKPALLDLQQRKWTWPLAETGVEAFPQGDGSDFVASLFAPTPGVGASPMRRALERLAQEIRHLEADWRVAHPQDSLVPVLLDRWLASLGATLDREEGGRSDDGRHGRTDWVPAAGTSRTGEAPEADLEAQVHQAALALGGARGWEASFAQHARSFRFAARLFPPEPARLVAGVYAFCRFTDDLVDRAEDPRPDRLEAMLAIWQGMVRRAWTHQDTGIPLLDEVFGETARRGVSVLYAEELIRGMAMDLRPAPFPDMARVRLYAYRVASVVGLWLTELFGDREPAILLRAERMGQAMQLTNILRDVGEDWRRGRLYLPLDRMAAHGISEAHVGEAVDTGRIPEAWPALMEELLQAAERDYEEAFLAIPALPPFFQRPVAVAAQVYAGIHDEIRRNRYDNLSQRAFTRLPTKLVLGGQGLLRLHAARHRHETGLGLEGLPPLSPPILPPQPA
jgi:phytoene synthase